MTIGIIGLGLIGGSLARAIASRTAHRVLGHDIDPATRDAALAQGALHGPLEAGDCGFCDLVLVALPPHTTLSVLAESAPRFRRGALVIDCCGVKRRICQAGFELAERHGFTFVGGHPMAGRESSGFASSLPTLFQGASMLLMAADPAAENSLRPRMEDFFLPLGFGRVVFTTAEHHDRMIALTSQLAHVVSNAYVKSPRAPGHRGYSAGSFADLTRVARLDEALWCELMMENRDYLLDEIDALTASLREYRGALERGDAGELRRLLKAGREIKETL